jgi:hypothetical protein
MSALPPKADIDPLWIKINTSFAALSWRGRTAEAEADDVKHDYFALI